MSDMMGCSNDHGGAQRRRRELRPLRRRRHDNNDVLVPRRQSSLRGSDRRLLTETRRQAEGGEAGGELREPGCRRRRPGPTRNMKELFEMMMQSVTSLATTLASSHASSQPSDQLTPPSRLPPPSCSRTFSRTAARRRPARVPLNHLKTEEQEAVVAEHWTKGTERRSVTLPWLPGRPGPGGGPQSAGGVPEEDGWPGRPRETETWTRGTT
ncbi:hypothetical protein D5F01_LYC14389 [Larimichthys crocea]|uniref:Uncharacterized protein n=1 Tax=Larimichthys crocea TaxID=215358 RepID=A0A6G0I4U8_LARCR|nr:hypothetical protein D5F01_LYC14389 [Larimichthys crocea]